MSFWLIIAGALFVQEGLSVIVVLAEAYKMGYSLLAIHAIWLADTLVQIYLGYIFGKWIQKRFANSKFEVRLKKYAESLDTSIGKRGEAVALLLMSGVISPGITALLGSWLNVSFRNIMIFAVLGDLIWYVSEWVTIIGAEHIASLLRTGTLLILIALIAITLIVKVVRKK